MDGDAADRVDLFVSVSETAMRSLFFPLDKHTANPDAIACPGALSGGPCPLDLSEKKPRHCAARTDTGIRPAEGAKDLGFYSTFGPYEPVV